MHCQNSFLAVFFSGVVMILSYKAKISVRYVVSLPYSLTGSRVVVTLRTSWDVTGQMRYLFPLDTGRGFGRHVQDDAAGVGHFVDDAGGGGGDEVIGEARPVGGHEIVGGDGTEGDGVIIGAFVTHDAHAVYAGEDGEVLVHLTLQARLGDFLPEDGVAFAHDFHLFGGHLADDADGQAGAGEGLPPDQFLRQAEGFAQSAHFVLKEHAQGLDQFGEAQFLGQTAHVVVALDDGGVGALAAFDHIGVNGALGEIIQLA